MADETSTHKAPERQGGDDLPPTADQSAGAHSLQVHGDRVQLGEWSGDLMELIGKSQELRELMRDGRRGDASALVQRQSVEEQAALVAIDENPEEILSLTGMDARGRPGYLPAVVDRLPTEILAGLVQPQNAKFIRFNTEVLQTMSPETFERAVDETLDPVYYHGNRGAVSWEWLEAVAALGDHNKAAELLFGVDESILEDALLERVDDFDMHARVASGDGTISAFRVLSESGSAIMLPPMTDPGAAETIRALHAAAPELLAKVVRNAWERAGAIR